MFPLVGAKTHCRAGWRPRRREFLLPVDARNKSTRIVVSENKHVLLREMLPYYWLDVHRLRQSALDT
jgi:hypothetical protein